MARILVTGAYGFAGSHFVEHAIETSDHELVCIYSLRHSGESLRRIESDRIVNIFHDLQGPISSRLAHKIGHVDYIVHMAAESHVERSIEDPVPFIQNNVNVTLNLLEYARSQNIKAFVQISTDEVYGPALQGDLHKEWREFVPSNPYAASKVAQEAICISYWRTFNIPLVLTNTMNLCETRQDPEKYIPMCVSRIAKGEVIKIHGTPKAIGSRQYISARGHADAILWLLHNTKPTKYFDSETTYIRPDRYNIVGDSEINNLELAQTIAQLMKKELRYEFIDFHSARPGHDRRYALDGSKIKNLGWKNPFTIEDTLKRVIDFTLSKPEWLV